MADSVGHSVVTSFIVFLALLSTTGALDLGFTDCGEYSNRVTI